MIINPVSSLTRRARDIYADRRMAAKWVLAARNLRAHHAWILEGAAPKWGCKPSPGRATSQFTQKRRESPLQY
ncbi:MAG: hypothetical protein A2W68_06710 [Betaproteobacteria bacterium RIFCSPLOWO2_02_64_14]|nr:MAG: hypothetical protein A2W68_06710 [Betaproteobacteria bacterium RIFCSPLOWO2_02_64_14]